MEQQALTTVIEQSQETNIFSKINYLKEALIAGTAALITFMGSHILNHPSLQGLHFPTILHKAQYIPFGEVVPYLVPILAGALQTVTYLEKIAYNYVMTKTPLSAYKDAVGISVEDFELLEKFFQYCLTASLCTLCGRFIYKSS